MERFQEIINNTPEKTIIVNKEAKSVLVVKTKRETMLEDIHRAFKEMQEMAGIKEEE